MFVVIIVILLIFYFFKLESYLRKVSGYRADVKTEATGYVVNAPLLLNSNDEISTPKSEDFDDFILLLEIRSV